MNAPTEYGWYWWTPPPLTARERREAEGWTETELAERRPQPVHLRFLKDGTPWTHPEPDAATCGTFGPRIPSPDRLAAMEEMAESDPIACIRRASYYWGCIYCCQETGGGDEEWVRSNEFKHAPDCPWLRSQEKPTPKETK